MSITDNLRRVRERIARAAEAAGRRSDEITLVGVTKYVGPREAAEFAAAGCTDLQLEGAGHRDRAKSS